VLKRLAPLIARKKEKVGVDRLANAPRDICLVDDALRRADFKVPFNALAIGRVEVPASETVRA